ncbi:MAG: M23 family metallopeptidase [Bacilli bacterium]|nr:M23 family metallopeptidase [Bacilli bacterium]MBQ7030840.1 M23 family metallopeptidase [Bacilli bacterium]
MSRIFKNYPNKITQKYKKGVHNGIDLVALVNKKSGFDYIVAHSDGVVVGCRNNYNKTDKTGNSYGNYVKIKHDNGYYTLSAHLKYKSVAVKNGDKVNKGQVVGYMGNTGHSKGAHNHFEVRNEKDVRIDPTPYIDSDLPSVNIWEIGKYKLLVSKAIRDTHELINNIVKVKQCMSSVKPNLTSSNPNDDAYYKVGTEVIITEIYVDKTTRVWGKLKNCWIVLCNKDGSHQAKKIHI